ncbi:NAD(P)/FAD-dependent oxidoreductase [Sulfitobacter sp. JBTF-M27]|uniref:NAD(P)/FAD-dependent oxidoreductase n=1 Tax=Sulfitobacter sediminilitoris TaxID=2698830 RepID=A0A6P0CEY8_9RHOB|nr:NAD(P)/FAD-dependent oxidoreductase [Sulfitobacter sediminilitoris]NEK24731.1 NAD(P)/FAD-dependent oxidoreductase [Sulfitobacter sediminilitoris]
MKTDYLVIGCGASAMAFVDTMLIETDATFVIVDTRDAPGGHWNDAYPFVRLHQPSRYYGVLSRPLGRDRINEFGPNAGFFELASGIEVLAYFHALMDEVFLPSGRVNWRPLSEWRDEDGVIVNLMTGKKESPEVARAIVDGRRIGTEIPLTYGRRFEVADDLACIPPNDLPRQAARYSNFAVIGGGKTAMDTVLWLLHHNVDPGSITWVRPRDSWLLNRRISQPGIEFFNDMIGAVARQMEILAETPDLDSFAKEMEAEGFWLRIDKDNWPDMMHQAVTSEAEVNALSRVENVIRMGHVQRADPGRLILEKGEVSLPADTLVIDCAASAAASNIDDRDPVFSPGRINLQMIRMTQPTFSAAVIAHLEATVKDEELKRRATGVTPMIDTVADWVDRRLTTSLNEVAWGEIEGMSDWLAACRLNASAHALSELDPSDDAKMAVLARLSAATPRARENMRRLVS